MLLIASPKYAFGNPKDIKTAEDCFNRRNVDDGVVFYKKIEASGDDDNVGDENEGTLYYWLHNCDADFIWLGPGERPIEFIKALKKAAYGDKYMDEEVDE